jgi:hypothetical protein
VSGFELVAGVIGGIFVGGIVIGVLLVAVFPKFRRHELTYLDGAGWQEPPPARDDDLRPPTWPVR